MSEGTVFGRVGVEARHGDAWPRDAKGVDGRMGRDADGFLKVFHREGVNGLAKWGVDGVEHDGELIVGQHHAHRRRLSWVCEVGQQFGVAWPMMASQVKGLF